MTNHDGRDNLPPIEQFSRRAPLAGPVSLDDSGFDVDAAVDELIKRAPPFLGALEPLNSRAYYPTYFEPLPDDDPDDDPFLPVGPEPQFETPPQSDAEEERAPEARVPLSAIAPAAAEQRAADARVGLAGTAADPERTLAELAAYQQKVRDDFDICSLAMPIDPADFVLRPPSPEGSDDEADEDEEHAGRSSSSATAMVAPPPLAEADDAVRDLSKQLAALTGEQPHT